nr:hypothetical protein [Brucepastera parasyntrophica]
MRSLAEVSNSQSKIISDNLKKLKQSIDFAVKNTDETGLSFDTIYSSVDVVTSVEREIKSAIDEQSAGSTQILDALGNIRRITEEIHEGSGKMTRGSSAITGEMNKLLNITEHIKSSSVDIDRRAKDIEGMVYTSSKKIDESLTHIAGVESQVAVFKTV